MLDREPIQQGREPLQTVDEHPRPAGRVGRDAGGQFGVDQVIGLQADLPGERVDLAGEGDERLRRAGLGVDLQRHLPGDSLGQFGGPGGEVAGGDQTQLDHDDPEVVPLLVVGGGPGGGVVGQLVLRGGQFGESVAEVRAAAVGEFEIAGEQPRIVGEHAAEFVEHLLPQPDHLGQPVQVRLVDLDDRHAAVEWVEVLPRLAKQAAAAGRVHLVHGDRLVDRLLKLPLLLDAVVAGEQGIEQFAGPREVPEGGLVVVAAAALGGEDMVAGRGEVRAGDVDHLQPDERHPGVAGVILDAGDVGLDAAEGLVQPRELLGPVGIGDVAVDELAGGGLQLVDAPGQRDDLLADALRGQRPGAVGLGDGGKRRGDLQPPAAGRRVLRVGLIIA